MKCAHQMGRMFGGARVLASASLAFAAIASALSAIVAAAFFVPATTSFGAVAQSVTAPDADAPANTIPGVTMWAWALDGQQPRWPSVNDGQTPNLYTVLPKVASIRDPLQTAEGPLADHFAGELRGWLSAPATGRYMFRIVGDDGARLIIDGRELADTERMPGFVGETGIDLAAGLHRIRIPFYENDGKFILSLSWMPPGTVAYEAIPPESLRTEAGQTPVTSPGLKGWHFSQDARRPGDGVPLVAPHPAYRLEKVRTPDFRPQVGALCFLPDGQLALAEWQRDGKVWILSGLEKNELATPSLFAEGLGEPLGLAWIDGALVLTQRGEITRLVDTDRDGRADRFQSLASGWPQSANYHEFTFNLVPWKDRLWFTTSVPLRGGLTNYMPGSDGDFTASNGPGSLWSIARAGGDVRREARGLRTPNGMGRGVDGELFVCDNQGSWLPASRLDHLKSGGFYGHQETRTGTERAEPPVVWFPHGEIGNSPSEPVLVADGPHRGQMYVGDVTYGGVTRVFVERIPGADGIARYQGAVFPMSQGIEAGVNRIAWGPKDHALYLGGVGSNGNWNHQGHTFGLQRLAPAWDTGAQGPDAARGAAFEMLRVQSRPGGFMLTFTKPVQRGALADPNHYEVQSWRYEPTQAYGGPKVDVRKHAVMKAEASSDDRQVKLDIEGLRPGTVVAIRLVGMEAADGTPPWSTNAWYTLNAIAPKELQFERFVGDPARPAGAAALLGGDVDPGATWKMLKTGEACAWQRNADGSLEVHTPKDGIGEFDIVSRREYEDVFVHVEWLSPAGGNVKDGQRNGNSGIKLQGRYEVQVMNTPTAPQPPMFNEAGSVYRLRAPDTNASTGAGTWQSYDIWFTAPRWERAADGTTRKTANARMTILWNGVLVHSDVEVKDKTGLSGAEAPGPAALLLQSHASDAEGPVRYRNVWTAEGAAMPARPSRAPAREP